MQRKYLSIAIGLFLSAGLAIAQAPAQTQPNQDQQGQPAASQDAQQQPLAGENAPPAEQGQRPHAPHPARAAHRLGKQLGLTQDQVAQIQPILANRQQQMESLRSDTTLTPQDRRVSGRPGQMVLNGAYLVERSRGAEFAALAKEIDAGHRHIGLALELSGPFAPYNFATAETERT